MSVGLSLEVYFVVFVEVVDVGKDPSFNVLSLFLRVD